MATQADLVADLRYRLNDAGDTQVTKADKTRYLNLGISATYPRLYRTVRDATTLLVADTFEYAMPSAVGASPFKILMVELETGAGSGRYRHAPDYTIIHDTTSPIISFDTPDLPSEVGAKIRITAIKPLDLFTESITLAETYGGPLGTEELPVLYAMGCIASKPLDDRLNHNQYSTAYVLGSPQPVDLMTTSQFWFAQFELLLDRFAMPEPPANG